MAQGRKTKLFKNIGCGNVGLINKWLAVFDYYINADFGIDKKCPNGKMIQLMLDSERKPRL